MTKEQIEARIAAQAFLGCLEKSGKAVMLSRTSPPKVGTTMQAPKYTPAMRRPKADYLRDQVKEGAAFARPAPPTQKDINTGYTVISKFRKEHGLPPMTRARYARFRVALYNQKAKAWKGRRKRLAKRAAAEPDKMRKGDVKRLLKGMGVVAAGGAVGAGLGYGARRALVNWAKKVHKDKGKADFARRLARHSPLGAALLTGGLASTLYAFTTAKRAKHLHKVTKGHGRRK
jgi:hypothetical protein